MPVRMARPPDSVLRLCSVKSAAEAQSENWVSCIARTGYSKNARCLFDTQGVTLLSQKGFRGAAEFPDEIGTTPQAAAGAIRVSRAMQRDWRPGVCCLVSLGLNERSKSRWFAACRLTDGTHELASDEQIDQYLADCERKRKEIQVESHKSSLVFAAPRPPAEALGGKITWLMHSTKI